MNTVGRNSTPGPSLLLWPAAAPTSSFSTKLPPSLGLQAPGGAWWSPGWGDAGSGAWPPCLHSAVRAQAKVYHYRISMAANGGLYLQKGCLFPSLEALLTYYQAHWELIHNPLLQPCVSQVGHPHPVACPSLGQAHLGGWEPMPDVPSSTLCLGPCPG